MAGRLKAKLDSRLKRSGMTDERRDSETILNISRIEYGAWFSTWFRMTKSKSLFNLQMSVSISALKRIAENMGFIYNRNKTNSCVEEVWLIQILIY